MSIGYGIRKMIGLALDIERLRDQQGISPLNEARYREAQAAIDTATHELEQNFIDDIRRISSLEKGKK